jgi:hypothetical protein
MISLLDKLANRAYDLFKGQWFKMGEPIIATFARELVDLNNDLLWSPSPINILLTGAYTLGNPQPDPGARFADGCRLIWRLQQDGTGGRTVSLGSMFRIPSSGTSPLPFSTVPNVFDIIVAQYDAAHGLWQVVSFVPGYPIS